MSKQEGPVGVPPHEPGESDDVARVYAHYLQRCREGQEPDFAAFCSKHPSLADELHQLHEDFEAAGFDAIDPSDAESPEQSLQRLLSKLESAGVGSARLKVLGEIARGGMGVIQRVWDDTLQRELAMKVALGRSHVPALSSTPGDQNVLSRFFEEAQITGQLNHPGIVPVHEMGLDSQGQAYFTMRLVKGRDLHEIFELSAAEADGWNRTRVLGSLLRVCEAMAYAHSKGVIHRDLKPRNVMVGRFGEVYVMDWGLARVLGKEDPRDLRWQNVGESTADLHTVRTESDRDPDSPLVTMDGAVVGTPAYMSPEQAGGELDQVDRRSDVYAIGAMLYELLTGQRPYLPPGRRATPHTVLAAVLQGPPTPLGEIVPDVPSELEAICAKAMQREPGERYRDTLELAEDLRAYLEGRVVHAYEAGAWAEARKWVQRNRPLAAALLVAFFAIVGGLGTVGWVQAGRAEEGRRVMRLSAFRALERLEERADDLWPVHPALSDDYRAWLSAADNLIAGLEPDPEIGDPGHRRQLALLRERAIGREPDGTYRFTDEEDVWWHGQLTNLVAALEGLNDPEVGLIHGISPAIGLGVGRRLALAESLGEVSTGGSEASARWTRAVDELARDSRFAGVELLPQVGLLPLGADPASGLQEFWHVLSGSEPVRDSDGRLQVTEEMGIVLVLIPGGSFRMGAQNTDPSGEHYDPDAEDDEAPVHDVVLTPFFLSKYEMTQEQWARYSGDYPSLNGPEVSKESWNKHGRLMDHSHPVENVSWNESAELVRRLGLALPTEAQWEYAARAGTETRWWPGDDPALLADAANVADSFAGRETSNWVCEEWDDGYVFHAPVGTYRANAFGLHDVIGNVWEWCRDGLGRVPTPYGESLRIDPCVEPDGRLQRMARGGDFQDNVGIARVSERGGSRPEYRGKGVGLRPARALNLPEPSARGTVTR